MAFYRSIGMKPLHVRKEIDGFIADRLLEALWREALWLVNDGVATTEEIDDAVRYGAGLRWSFMGTFLIYRMAGGEAGHAAFPGAIRAGVETAMDQARSAGTHGRSHSSRLRTIRRASRARLRSASWRRCATIASSPCCRACAASATARGRMSPIMRSSRRRRGIEDLGAGRAIFGLGRVAPRLPNGRGSCSIMKTGETLLASAGRVRFEISALGVSYGGIRSMSENSKNPAVSSGLMLDRRQLMSGAAALGIGYGLPMGQAFADDAPKKGGTLRLGMEGGSASDSLDPRTYANSIPISYGWQICNGLVEVDEKGDAVRRTRRKLGGQARRDRLDLQHPQRRDLRLRQDARRRRRHLFAEPASRRHQIGRQGSARRASPTSRSSRPTRSRSR